MIDRAVGKVVGKRSIDGRADAPSEDEGGGQLWVLKLQQGAILDPAVCVDDNQGWGEGLG